jgi:hypothetical protein
MENPQKECVMVISKQNEEESGVHKTLQRLVNGESSNYRTYLDAFFDGKSYSATERGADALLAIIQQGACASGSIPVLIEYLLDLGRRRGFAVPIEQAVVEIVRRILSDGSEEGFTTLGVLLRMENDRYLRIARDEIAHQAVKAVLRPNMWLEIVKRFFWTGAFHPAATNMDLSPHGNPDLVRLFQNHCSHAGDVYAGRGEFGVAAALYTISGMRTDLRDWYQRALRSEQAIPMDCIDTQGMHHPLSRSKPGLDEEIYRELFGTDWRSHPECRLRERHAKERFVLDKKEAVVLASDVYSQRVAEAYLSHGRWSDAQRALKLYSSPKTGQGRSISSIVLPAMYLAECEGRISVAAALGQIALTSHGAAPSQGRNAECSLIVRVARSITDGVFANQEGRLQFDIQDRTYQFPSVDSMGVFREEDSLSIPESLQRQRVALAGAKSVYQTKLVGEILRKIRCLFDTVIEQGVPLELEIF